MKKINDKTVFIITLNTKDNLSKIIENWSNLIEHQNLCIYFVNPASQLETKWVVCPYTHNKITEKASLKSGLETLFSMVEPYNA